MSKTIELENDQNAAKHLDSGRGLPGLPSLKIVVGSLLMVALVLALGMTGGQVRQLAGRVTSLEDERVVFERRVDGLREDNQNLIGRLRDYQQVLEVAQGSNISLSKRLENRDMVVNDLQTSLDAILKEKYATENALRGEIAQLENLKRDLSAQVAALGQAVAAQSKEIENLDRSYRLAERNLSEANVANSSLLAENNRYLDMMTQLQDEIEVLQEESIIMAERFDALRTESVILEQEKVAIQRELQSMRDTPDEPFGFDSAPADPFSGQDPFGPDSDAVEGRDGLPGNSEVASADDMSA